MSVTATPGQAIADSSSRVTREQQALAELGDTRYSRGVREMLVAAFLVTIITVPMIENVSDFLTNLSTRREMLERGVDAEFIPARRPRSFDLVPWRKAVSARSFSDVVNLVPTPRFLREYENTLVINSAAGQLIRPWIQWALTSWLGTGSEKVFLGQDGWLYYSDGVQYVTGPGFLDPQQLARRAQDEGTGEDPRDAILQFRDELQRVGASLVVFPVPDKAMVRPASLSSLVHGASSELQNPSWSSFAADLQRKGVLLLDISHEMRREEDGGRPQFVRTDSHWSPAGADFAAGALARFLTDRVGVPSGQPQSYRRQRIDFSSRGDMAQLLSLPSGRERMLFPAEQLTAWQVTAPSGGPWQPASDSEILVIGDSFLEAYSVEQQGFVAAAGLAEQLSYHLQRPVDRLAGHKWGTYSMRAALGKSLSSVRELAARRKIIIWEFAIRTLSSGDWQLME